jgi:hypothetical protein
VRRTLVAVAVVALAAACGGGNERLAQAEFARRGNAICRELFAKLDALPQAKSAPALAQVMERARTDTDDALGRLDDLRPPEAREQAFEQFRDRVRDEVALAEDVQRAAEQKDLRRALRVANRGVALDGQAHAAAARAGLGGCARRSRR